MEHDLIIHDVGWVVVYAGFVFILFTILDIVKITITRTPKMDKHELQTRLAKLEENVAKLMAVFTTSEDANKDGTKDETGPDNIPLDD